MTFSFGWPDLEKKHGKVFSALLSTFVLFYLVSHVLGGERGLYMLLKEQRRLDLLHAELDEVTAKRKSLELKTNMLRPESLDLDLVDEQSRRYLGEAEKDEIVIPLKPSDDK